MRWNFAAIMIVLCCAGQGLSVEPEGVTLQQSFLTPIDFYLHLTAKNDGLTAPFQEWLAQNPGITVTDAELSAMQPSGVRNPHLLLTVSYRTDTATPPAAWKLFLLPVMGEQGLRLKENDETVNTWARENADAYAVVSRQAHLLSFPGTQQLFQAVFLKLGAR